MWRSSLSFSSTRKLLSSSSSSSPSSLNHHSLYSVATRLLQSLSGSSSPPSTATPSSHPNSSISANSVVGLIEGANGVGAFASSSSFAAVTTAAFDISLLASLRAREAVDLARHYGRCYWVLSKARLKSAVDIPRLCWTCGGTIMVAAAANSLNQALDTLGRPNGGLIEEYLL